jgi:hypothetical protein
MIGEGGDLDRLPPSQPGALQSKKVADLLAFQGIFVSPCSF